MLPRKRYAMASADPPSTGWEAENVVYLRLLGVNCRRPHALGTSLLQLGVCGPASDCPFLTQPHPHSCLTLLSQGPPGAAAGTLSPWASGWLYLLAQSVSS